jgi:hypothetical protein
MKEQDGVQHAEWWLHHRLEAGFGSGPRGSSQVGEVLRVFAKQDDTRKCLKKRKSHVLDGVDDAGMDYRLLIHPHVQHRVFCLPSSGARFRGDATETYTSSESWSYESSMPARTKTCVIAFTALLPYKREMYRCPGSVIPRTYCLPSKVFLLDYSPPIVPCPAFVSSQLASL